MKTIMLGTPNTGKGTQAKKIAAEYQIPYISTGDIFQTNIKNGMKLGMKAKSYMNTGGLVPDKITIGMLLDRIHEEGYKDGYTLDRFPRAIPQAESLTKALGDVNEATSYAINMDVPDENIINHVSGCRTCLSRGATYHIVCSPPRREGICDVRGRQLVLRDDDGPGTVKKRLDVCHDQTQPLIGYYKKAGVLAEVDGTLDMGEVFQAIVGTLGA